ncbi:MAG: zeta toxin family protein [Bacteroidales bacterium]|nr:zeta toxin family protein [Bacteroidales bacterium]
MKQIFIIAGPNGAGKTTASRTILPDILHCTEFVNADEIAKGLSPFNPEGVSIQAGRIMLKRIEELLQHNSSFAFETTLSTKSYVSLIRKAKAYGYVITLLFFYLPSAEHAAKRVMQRVLEGGHNIPYDIIVRRYSRGLENLMKLYVPICDAWFIYDNSSSYQINLIAEGSSGLVRQINDQQIFKKIQDYERTANR